MRLTDLFNSRRFVLSIEMFPPKTAETSEALKRSLLSLNRYNPAFVSCTYGARRLYPRSDPRLVPVDSADAAATGHGTLHLRQLHSG